MTKRKEIGVLSTSGDVQGNSVENNANNNRGRPNTEAIQLQPPPGNRNIGVIAVEPGINDLPQQKGQTNVIRVVSTGTSSATPANVRVRTLKINGKNYTFLAP